MDKLFGSGPLAPTLPQLLLQAAPTAAQGVLFPRSTGGQIGKALFQGAAGLAPLVGQNLAQQQFSTALQGFLQPQAAQGVGQQAGLPSVPAVGSSPSQGTIPEPTNFTEFVRSKSSDDQALLLQLLTGDPERGIPGIPQEVFFTKPTKPQFAKPGDVPVGPLGQPSGPAIPTAAKVLTPSQELQEDARVAISQGLTLPGMSSEQTRDAALGFGRPPTKVLSPAQQLQQNAVEARRKGEALPGLTMKQTIDASLGITSRAPGDKVLNPKEQLQKDARAAIAAGKNLPGLTKDQTRDAALGFGRPPAPKALPTLSQDLNETAEELYPVSTGPEALTARETNFSN